MIRRLLPALLLALAASFAHAQELHVQWTNATTNVDGTPIEAGTDSALRATYIEFGTCNSIGQFDMVEGVVEVAPSAVEARIPVPEFDRVYCVRGQHENVVFERSTYSATASTQTFAPIPSPPVIATGAEQVAYNFLKRPDTGFMLPVGTVPAGTSCSPAEGVLVGGVSYYAVPTAAVTWYNTDTRPDVVYALCDG